MTDSGCNGTGYELCGTEHVYGEMGLNMNCVTEYMFTVNIDLLQGEGLDNGFVSVWVCVQ